MPVTQKPKKNTEKKSVKEFHLTKTVTTPSHLLYSKYKKDHSSQFTSLFIRTYASTEEVERLLEVLKPDEYAYILHDKDKKVDGTPKEPHIHLLVYKRSQIRLTKILKFTETKVYIEIPRSKKYAYEYLTHKNDPDKTAYSLTDVVEYHERDNTFSVTEQEARSNRYIDMLDDIVSLSRRDMAIKYGTDYIKNYQRYESFMNVVTAEEMEKEANALAYDTPPSTEIFVVPELDGDTIRMTLADFICLKLRDKMLGDKMPTCNELIRMYYDILQQARDYRHDVSYALRVNEGEIDI